MAADLFPDDPSLDGATALERLSALVDGELDANAVSSACARWRADDSVRVAWHRYQLIGDVLRSDDLVSTPDHDEAFIVALRARLAHEPVVLAPEPLAAPPRPRSAFGRRAADAGSRRWSWAAPGAVAAGFVAVAGVLMVIRGAGTAGIGPVDERARVASAQNAGSAAVVPVNALANQPPSLPATLVEPQPLPLNGKFVRDAGLDRYLAAHQQFAGTSALGVPSAYLRSATADMSNR